MLSVRMPRPSRDQVNLVMTKILAERSTCCRRKVGCILVDARGRILATGYNGVAAGRPHCNEGHPCKGADLPSGQGLDSCEAIHAEQNAILLLSDPFAVDTCYLTTTPCVSCIKLLLGTSCKRILALEEYPHSVARDYWVDAGRSWEIADGRFSFLEH